MSLQERPSFSVSQLNHYIQQVINAGFPDEVWVCGEIQGYNRSKDKKHVFFDLCETDAENKTVNARIGLVIFSNRKILIERILREAGDPFEIKDDIEVKFLCKVDFYPPHGMVRLIVEEIDPFYTLGKIALEKQRLITLLKKNGTLDKNKGVSFPGLPLRIGLVTSHDSAAYNDFISELKSSGLGFDVIYRNTLMQGKAVEQDVCRALEEFYQESSKIDVIVITRGGGSIADLSCFDSRKIAEKIALSPVPVISGIGHEIDLTVTDLAAHIYRKTPTAVAQFLVVQIQNALDEMNEKKSFLLDAAGQKIKESAGVLHHHALGLQSAIREFLKDHEREISGIENYVRREPLRYLHNISSEAINQGERLFDSIKFFLRRRKDHLLHAGRFIDASHPDQICKKGFSITRTCDGKLVRSLKDVSEKSIIKTFLNDGCIDSSVIKIEEEEGHGR